MPIPKALASYFLFASYVHLYQPLTKRCSGCAVLKHESRELNDFWNINVQKLNE